MKKIIIGICCGWCLTTGCVSLMAQTNPDAKYLVGAVPEVNGKVVFSKEYQIPGMSQEEVFDRVANWMEGRLALNKNNSRVVLKDKEKGQLVGLSDEWIVFSSTALSLDRTRILYQLFVECQAESCRLEVNKINYIYREGKERYSAEEWVVDKYALNKDKTKLVRGLAKWRRKTVDLMDSLCLELADALSAVRPTPEALAAAEAAAAEEQKKEEKSVATSGTMVINQRNRVEMSGGNAAANAAARAANTANAAANAANTANAATNAAAAANAAANATAAANAAANTTAAANATSAVVSNAPAAANAPAATNAPAAALNPSEGRLVIVIGSDPFNMTMMTANAGGSLGTYQGKQVIFTILSPDQPYDQMERAESYEVRFYPNGANQPSLTFRCRKMQAPAAIDGMPRTYIGEIIK